MASGLSNFFINKVVDAAFRGQSYTFPSTVYVAVCTGTCTAATAVGEVTTGTFSRIAVASSLANWSGTQGAGTTAVSSGTTRTISNNSIVSYGAGTATASVGTLTYLALFDAASGGNYLGYASLSTQRVITSGDPMPRFSANALQISLPVT